ncbi:Uncharacterised protein [Mycobacteroides abscessus subsp. abscessus]|nr:Uncharacterised protein [Mycobacteroides abscessus subsp. abscessus]
MLLALSGVIYAALRLKSAEPAPARAESVAEAS